MTTPKKAPSLRSASLRAALEDEADALLGDDFLDYQARHSRPCAAVHLDDDTINDEGDSASPHESISAESLCPFYRNRMGLDDELEETKKSVLSKDIENLLDLLGNEAKNVLDNIGTGFLSARRQQQIIEERRTLLTFRTTSTRKGRDCSLKLTAVKTGLPRRR